MAEVHTYPDVVALARAAAELFVSIASEAVAARGRFTVALSGGSTPRPLHRELASDPFRDRVEWAKVHVFWGDERMVPPNHEMSNYRMARETLLDHVPVPPQNVHRIHGELDAVQAAARYADVLRDFFGSAGPPRLDLIFLGMGTDGHTASLFPGSALLKERRRWVAGVPCGQAVEVPRVTLTPVVLNAAANVAFLVKGAAKAGRLQEILAGSEKPRELPAQLVEPEDGRLVWLVDRAANPGRL